MLNRPLPAPARDVAILIGRVILGVVLFAHGWQKLMINGISGTYGQFEKLGIPLAIVSASFASFVEFVGGVLIILGALTSVVVALDLVVMVGAAGFVHFTHGIFAQDGGWELVGVIVAAELALAAFGPGRFSVDHLITQLRQREHDDLRRRMQKPVRRPAVTSETFTPAVDTSAARSYPTGGFAALDQVERPADAAARTEGLPVVAHAGSPTLTVADVVTGAPPASTPASLFTETAAAAASTGAFAATTAAPVPAGGFGATSPGLDGFGATSYASMPTGAFAAIPPSVVPTDAFASTPPPVEPTGAFAAIAQSLEPTGAYAPIPPSAAGYSVAAASDVSTAGFSDSASASATASNIFATAPPAAPPAAPSTSRPAAAEVRAAADPGTPGPAASHDATALAPRMASAGVHRAMSERAGRSAEEPAPFGVTVQSPLDFTPTAAFPIVPPSSVTEMIAVATPAGLPRRVVRHTPDLPRASAVRPYA